MYLMVYVYNRMVQIQRNPMVSDRLPSFKAIFKNSTKKLIIDGLAPPLSLSLPLPLPLPPLSLSLSLSLSQRQLCMYLIYMYIGVTGEVRVNEDGDGSMVVNIWSYEQNANFSPYMTIDLIQDEVRATPIHSGVAWYKIRGGGKEEKNSKFVRYIVNLAAAHRHILGQLCP